MTVLEIMERAGATDTGRAERIDITADQRFYEFPKDMIKVLDIRCKNHLNVDDEYRSIPRMIGEPIRKDADGN